MSNLSRVVSKLGIKLTATHKGLVIPPENTKGDKWEHDLWSVTLSYQGRELTTEYRTGLGHRKMAQGTKKTHNGLTTFYYSLHNGGTPNYTTTQAAQAGLLVVKTPDVADVVLSLIVDSSCAEHTFDEWCSEFGYDTDSRKALDTYLKCQENYIKLRQLLGSATFTELVGLEHLC